MASASADCSAGSSSGSLVDQAFTAEAVCRKRKRVSNKSIEGLTTKKVYDNFKDFTDHERFGVLDKNGMSLHDRLKVVVENHLQNPKKYPLGANLYRSLRDEFRAEGSPQKALEAVVTDEDDKINPQLLKAAIAFQKSRNKSVFNGVLHTLDSVSLKDLVGICQYGLSIRPSASSEQLRYGVDLMNFFVRLQISVRFPEQAEVMKPLWDKVLCEAHIKSGPKLSLPSVFVERFGDSAWLVLPKEAAMKLLTSTSWLDAQDELAIVTKSDIGMRLFGSGLRSVQNEIVQKRIDKAFDDLMGNGKLSESSVRDAIASILKELLGLEVLVGMPERRKVTVSYLQRNVEIPVKSMHEQVQLGFAVRWKSLAVSAGLLQPMFCELELASPIDVDNDVKGRIDVDLLRHSKVVREMTKEGCNILENEAGNDIMFWFSKEEARLASIDPTIKIEIKFFESMNCEKGQELLQARFMAEMPTATRHTCIENAVQSLSVILNSQLYKFVCPGIQGFLRTALDIVHCVAESRQPVFDKQVKGFLLQVKERLPFFATMVMPKGQILAGADAIKAELELVEEKAENQVAFDDFRLSTQFGWLLSDKQAVIFEKVKAQAMRNHESGLMKGSADVLNAQKRRASSKAKSTSTSASSSARPVLRQKTSEVEAALAMFNTLTTKSSNNAK